MLVNFVTEKSIIFFPECITQLYFSVFTIAEYHMLAAMAYDCYVVIFNPLLYNVTMSYQVCSWMVVGMHGIGLIGATANIVCMVRLVFWYADIINHYYCDLFPLLEFSCSTTLINEVVGLCFSAFNIIVSALTILGSYIFIIPASSTFAPLRAGPKPSLLAATTSLLLLSSLVLQHSCTCSHPQSAPGTKGKCSLCFTPLLCLC
jgi:hypothetical protein